MILGPCKRYADTRLKLFHCDRAYDNSVVCRELWEAGWMLMKVCFTLTGKAASSARIRADQFENRLSLLMNNEYLFDASMVWAETLEAHRSEIYSKEVYRRRRKKVKPGDDLMAQWYVSLGDPELISSGYFLNGRNVLRVNFPSLPVDVFEPDSAVWTVELMLCRVIQVPLTEEEMTYVSSRTAK